MRSNPPKAVAKVPPMLVTAAVAAGQSVGISAVKKLRPDGSWRWRSGAAVLKRRGAQLATG